MLSVVVSRWLPPRSTSSFPRKNRSTPTSRIVATGGSVPPRNRSMKGLGRFAHDVRRPAPYGCPRRGRAAREARVVTAGERSSPSSTSRHVLRDTERLPAHGRARSGTATSRAACSRAPGTAGSTTSGRARTTSTMRSGSRRTRSSSRTARSRSSFETPGADAELARGLELIRRGEYFAAHEVLEDVWRAAERGRARLLPGPGPRRGRLVPGGPRERGRLRAPAREGCAAARALRARSPRARRRRAARVGRGGARALPRPAAARAQSS